MLDGALGYGIRHNPHGIFLQADNNPITLATNRGSTRELFVNRRTFLKEAMLASSAYAVANTTQAQDAEPVAIRRIAVEETFALPEVLDALRTLVENEPDREPGLAAPPYVVTDTIQALTDLGEGRIAAMDAAGVDVQVLSHWSPGVQPFDPGQANELARLVNDRLAEAIGRFPDRLAGLATVAPQDPATGAMELERAIANLGLNGLLINSHTNGEHLDDPKFWPILEAAQALNAPVYLHPRTPPAQMYDAYTDYLMDRALWGFAAETSLHVVRLIMGGVFDQFPRLQIVLGHMGEGIPFWLSRLDEVSARTGMPELQRRPSDYVRDNMHITTSAMFWDPTLTLCLDVLGAERIMFGVDSPFASSEQGTRWLDNAPISAADRRMIYQENAERVFSL